MDRVAAFVDAGYLFAAGAQLISGKNRPRGELQLNYDAVLEEIERLAASVSGLPLLRIYWYDGTSTGPTSQHLTLAFKPCVKLRLGFVNALGEQKGVDSLLITDLINLARNKAMADALLLTGDEDIRVGVQQAQEFGVRVHLLGIEPSRANQSQFLVQEADSLQEWNRETVARFLTHRPKSEPAGTGQPPGETLAMGLQNLPRALNIEQVALEAAGKLSGSDIEGVLRLYDERRRLPAEIDRPLLGSAKKQFGLLSPDQRRQLREAFVSALKQRQADGTASRNAT